MQGADPWMAQDASLRRRDTDPMPIAPRISPRDQARTKDRLTEYDTARARAGRPFVPTGERALDSALRSLAARLPRAARGVVAIPEMPGPAGVPDLVAIPSPDGLTARLRCNVPPLLIWGDALVAASVSAARPESVRTIAARSGLRDDVVKRRLRRLASIGAVSQTHGGRYVRNTALAPIGRIYALEAKVDNWSSGIGQALRYGAWADASGVVLAHLPSDRSKALAQATSLGVGLAVGARWLVRPRIHAHGSARRLWASEHVLAALELSTPRIGARPTPDDLLTTNPRPSHRS